jgi:dipeptidyl-peptidase-4
MKNGSIQTALLEFLDDNSFLWASERDGNRHLYWYDKDGKLKKQVTKGNWEVTDYYGLIQNLKKFTFRLQKKEASTKWFPK